MAIIQPKGGGSTNAGRKRIEGEMSLSRIEEMEATDEPAWDKNIESSSGEEELNVWGETRDVKVQLREWKNKWTKEALNVHVKLVVMKFKSGHQEAIILSIYVLLLWVQV